MCLSSTLSKLDNTISFFHDAYSCYEDYLAASFPFGLYKQIFLPSEMVVSPTSFGASTCIFSADILNDEKVIDQVYACVLSAFSHIKCTNIVCDYFTNHSMQDSLRIDSGMIGA
uniref:Uncharacterized protein n=1 Tax=Aegilops tauschii subsp. strangulata TaxID=200361 RepID=A0A453KT57_AEGTS